MQDVVEYFLLYHTFFAVCQGPSETQSLSQHSDAPFGMQYAEQSTHFHLCPSKHPDSH